MAEGETFVGYHGTSIPQAASLLRGVTCQPAVEFAARRQLGVGFYTVAEYRAATDFARVAAVTLPAWHPLVVYVYARGFESMTAREVPAELWWTLPDDSPYVAECDYLTATVSGYGAIRQIKFNPRAHGALAIRVPG